MRGRKTKGKRFSKAVLITLLFLAAAGGLLYFCHPAVFAAAGRYLALEGEGSADVVILEGEEMITEEAVKVGVGIVRSGRARGLVIVYQNSDRERPLGKPADYTLFLMQKMGDWGLKSDQMRVFSVPQDHPITLNEARVVLSHLSGDKIQSAILVAKDFHARRSYWAYKKVGTPLGVRMIPHPYFSRFKNDAWWRDSRGVRNFAEEAVKFLGYVLWGHIPLKSLVMD